MDQATREKWKNLLRQMDVMDRKALAGAVEEEAPDLLDGPLMAHAPAEGEVIHRLVTASKTTAIDRKKMELEAVVSAESVDSYNDIIRAPGWDFARWLRNPVVMFAHSYYSLPVAQGLSIDVSGTEVISRMRFWNGDGLWGDFAREVFDQYAAEPPFMRGFSVGFLPIEWDWITEVDDDGVKHYIGIEWKRQELLEYSSVPIPANRDALTLAMKEGRFPRTAGILKEIFGARTLQLTIENGPRPESADDGPAMGELVRETVKWWTRTNRRRLARRMRRS